MYYQAKMHYKSRLALVEQLFDIYTDLVPMSAGKDNRPLQRG